MVGFYRKMVWRRGLVLCGATRVQRQGNACFDLAVPLSRQRMFECSSLMCSLRIFIFLLCVLELRWCCLCIALFAVMLCIALFAVTLCIALLRWWCCLCSMQWCLRICFLGMDFTMNWNTVKSLFFSFE